MCVRDLNPLKFVYTQFISRYYVSWLILGEKNARSAAVGGISCERQSWRAVSSLLFFLLLQGPEGKVPFFSLQLCLFCLMDYETL